MSWGPPGLFGQPYEEALCIELGLRGLKFDRQRPLPVTYKGHQIDLAYRTDVIVEGEVLLELKAIDKLAPIHDAQLLTYMKLAGIGVGFLMNFNVLLMKDGIVRRVL